MTTIMRKKRGKTQRRPRRLLVAAILLSGVLVAAGGAWFIRHRAVTSHAAGNETALIDPPVVELGGVDPAVARAIEKARMAVQQSPRSVAAWGLLGKTLLAHDFHVAANPCLAQAERLEPTAARWPYLQGLALILADPPDPGTAIERFQRAVELGGDTPDALCLRLGEALLGQDRLEEAEAQFQRILQLDPANARAHLGLARVALQRDDPGKSRSHLDRVLSDPRTKKASLLLLMQVQQRLGKPPSAEEVRGVGRLPEDAGWSDPFWDETLRLRTGLKTDLGRAEKLVRQGRVPEAIARLQQIIKDYPDSYYAWLIFGRALIKQRNLKAAEQALTTALKLAPDSAETQFDLGVALSLQSNFRAAEALFRRAVEAKPDFTRAHYNLGCCLFRQGNQAGADESFRAALRCEPDYADAHTALSEVLVKKGQRVEALVHALRALQHNPADATAKKLVGRLLMQLTLPTGP